MWPMNMVKALTGEGAGLLNMCQAIVQRYTDAEEPEPQVIYVDQDCCNEARVPALNIIQPWKSEVRLDIFHFMRGITRPLIKEHHVLFGTFCSKLSACIFEWDDGDRRKLKQAKDGELQKNHSGHVSTEEQISANITTAELSKHCRGRTLG